MTGTNLNEDTDLKAFLESTSAWPLLGVVGLALLALVVANIMTIAAHVFGKHQHSD
ncbi:MAG: hypothetical protein IPL86_13360 [Flavobacteriales bacterium]|nr:hypothetical protein [Flavobacteriales bacterium]